MIRVARPENTIFVRMCRRHGPYGYECFGKARGEGFIAGGYTRADAIEAGNLLLWAINKYGPADFKKHAPFDANPDRPTSIIYPVQDEL